MFGANWVFGDAAGRKDVADVLDDTDSQLLGAGECPRLLASFCAYSTMPWLCWGIWLLVSVTVLTPKVSPRVRGERPGPLPCWQPARPAKFGSWKVVWPLPP